MALHSSRTLDSTSLSHQDLLGVHSVFPLLAAGTPLLQSCPRIGRAYTAALLSTVTSAQLSCIGNPLGTLYPGFGLSRAVTSAQLRCIGNPLGTRSFGFGLSRCLHRAFYSQTHFRRASVQTALLLRIPCDLLRVPFSPGSSQPLLYLYTPLYLISCHRLTACRDTLLRTPSTSGTLLCSSCSCRAQTAFRGSLLSLCGSRPNWFSASRCKSRLGPNTRSSSGLMKSPSSARNTDGTLNTSLNSDMRGTPSGRCTRPFTMQT